MMPLTLPDAQWQVLYGALQTIPGLYVGQEAKIRRFLEAVLWLMRSGAAWRLLPTAYGKWNSIYMRFARWEERGVWTTLLQQVAANPDLEWLVLDSTIIRAHLSAVGAPKKKVAKRRKRLGAAVLCLASELIP